MASNERPSDRKSIANLDADADASADFKPLTVEEAKAWRQRNPAVSPWRVIGLQAGAGLLVALTAGVITQRAPVAWSAGYGALAVVVPAAIFARGLAGRLASMNPNTAMLAFFVWEAVKMALTFAMLLAAPRLVWMLSWPAMLVGLVVAIQAYWVALLLVPKRK